MKSKNFKNNNFKLVIKGELSLELLHSFISLDINRDGNSLKLNKMKNYFYKNFSNSISLLVFLISLFSLKGDFLNAEYLFEELEIDTSTKKDDNTSAIPTNPFEIVEMIRRQNSLNDATNPSDAIDDALKSFNSLEEK